MTYDRAAANKAKANRERRAFDLSKLNCAGVFHDEKPWPRAFRWVGFPYDTIVFNSASDVWAWDTGVEITYLSVATHSGWIRCDVPQGYVKHTKRSTLSSNVVLCKLRTMVKELEDSIR